MAHAGSAAQAELTRTLVGQLRQGDERAGRLLDTLYRARLHRFSFGYLGSQEEAEDVVQEVFCRVLTSDETPDCFRAWIYRITRNLCLDRLRSRKRRPDADEHSDDSQFAVGVTGNLTRLVRQEKRAQVAQALRSLPPHQQDALRLRYAEGLSRAEIAEVLDLAPSVVKSRIFEGLEVMRQRISALKEKD